MRIGGVGERGATLLRCRPIVQSVSSGYRRRPGRVRKVEAVTSDETERSYVPVDDPADRPRTTRRDRPGDHDRPRPHPAVRGQRPRRAGRAMVGHPGRGDRCRRSPRTQAAIREVAEETGYRLSEADLLGPIAIRHVVHGYSDQVIEQDEAFYLAMVQPFEVDISAHTPDEQMTLLQHRWWSHDDLRHTDEWIWPVELVELWSLVGEPETLADRSRHPGGVHRPGHRLIGDQRVRSRYCGSGSSRLIAAAGLVGRGCRGSRTPAPPSRSSPRSWSGQSHSTPGAKGSFGPEPRSGPSGCRRASSAASAPCARPCAGASWSCPWPRPPPERDAVEITSRRLPRKTADRSPVSGPESPAVSSADFGRQARPRVSRRRGRPRRP